MIAKLCFLLRRHFYFYPAFFVRHVLTDGSSYVLAASFQPIFVVVGRMRDICQSGVWVYIDTPRQHAGYARFVRRYSPVRFALNELRVK